MLTDLPYEKIIRIIKKMLFILESLSQTDKILLKFLKNFWVIYFKTQVRKS